jgi:hypothetical protein
MIAYGFLALAEGLSGQQRLALVAVLLGVLVFGAVVLLVEHRNVTHETPPLGLSAMEPVRRDIRRGPAVAVPIPSARIAADAPEPTRPYTVPFLDAPPDPPASEART